MKNLASNLKSIFKYDFLRYIFLILLLGLSLYLLSGYFLFIRQDPPYLYHVIFSSFVSLGFLGFSISEYKLKGRKPNIYIVGASLIVFVMGLLVILLRPSDYLISSTTSTGNDIITAHIVLSGGMKAKAIFCMLSLLIAINLLLNYVPYMVNPRDKIVHYFFVICVAIFIVLCIVSLFIEFDSYVDLIRNINNRPEDHTTKSLFNHHNTWGSLLLLIILSCFYLYLVFNKKVFIPISIVFFCFMFFSLCKSALLLATISFVAVFVYKLTTTYKDNKKRNMVIIVVASSLLIVATVLCFTVDVFKNFFINTIIGNASTSFDTRAIIWDKVFQISKEPQLFIFGHGYTILNEELYWLNILDYTCSANWNVRSAHNVYVQSFGDFGIVGVILFLAIIVYVIYHFVRYYKEDAGVSFMLLLCSAILLIHCLFES